MITLSASKIITYKTCGQRYKYIYIDKINNHKNVSALLGTALHKALENGKKDESFDVFSNTMNVEYKKWQDRGYAISGEDIFYKSMFEGKQILKDFEWETLKFVETSEHRFDLPFPSVDNPICNMSGIIDRIDFLNDKYYIYDYKSSKIKPIIKNLKKDSQFIIYYWAFNELYKTFPDKVYWYHLRSNKIYDTSVESDYENSLKDLIKDIKEMIDSPNYDKIENGNTCKYLCNFKCYGDG